MMYSIHNRARFYIRLSALIMLFCFLVVDLISAIYFPIGIAQQLSYGERVSFYYSFFTTQSNYLVALYFSYYLYTSFFKGTIPHFQVRLAVTVYITVTMLVFWLGIFTQVQDPYQYTLYAWIETVILHLIMPITMIMSFIFSSGKEAVNIRSQHHNYLWVIAIYPIIYSIVILIRGQLRYLDHKPSDTWYPYYFFNYQQPYGVFIATGAVIVILGLIFSLQYFYIWFNNLMYELYSTDEERLEYFYLKTLKKLSKRIHHKKKKNKSK